MGCGSCGTSGAHNGTAGCGSSGGCSSGGCNKMNTYNWLSDIPLSDFGSPFSIVEISFNEGSRKEFYINTKNIDLYSGALVTVEGANGIDVGMVSLYGELVKLQLKKQNVKEEDVQKKILRFSQAAEIELLEEKKLKEQEILVKARAIARSHNLDMKIGKVALQADGKKLIIYYTAHSRVDFREVLKIYASTFNARIEMKQIGARQESGIVGGIGSCGRELCCSTWLTDFKAVTTSAARYQNLSINQTKLSGQCGKLKCCLNYELDTYMEAFQVIPNNCDEIEVKDGKCRLVKKDVLKGLLYYSFAGSTRQHPLTIERVVYILEQNKQGVKPDELGAETIVYNVEKVTTSNSDAGFVNDVGQISYDALVKKNNKNKKKKKPTSSKPNNNIKGDTHRPNDNRPPKTAHTEGKPSEGRPTRSNQAEGKPANRPPRPVTEGTSAMQQQKNANRPNPNNGAPRPKPNVDRPKPDPNAASQSGDKPPFKKRNNKYRPPKTE